MLQYKGVVVLLCQTDGLLQSIQSFFTMLEKEGIGRWIGEREQKVMMSRREGGEGGWEEGNGEEGKGEIN